MAQRDESKRRGGFLPGLRGGTLGKTKGGISPSSVIAVDLTPESLLMTDVQQSVVF